MRTIALSLIRGLLIAALMCGFQNPAQGAYGFVAGSTQYLSTSSSPVNGNPMTIAFWFKSAGVNGCGVFVGGASATQRNNVFILPASGAVVNAGSVNSAGTSASVNSTTTFTDGVWSHAAAVYTSDSSRTAYCNGGGAATNTTTITTTPGFNSVLVGARWSGSLGGYFTGDIAEVGIWSVALTAAEIASLAAGFTPSQVRPQSLVFYAPLVGGQIIDVVGGRTITNNNGATIAAHPRIYP